MSDSKFVVKDSGARQEFETGSRRDLADGKGRFDLIPTLPMHRLAVHYENGSKKYGDRNWERGQPLSRYLDSAERHLNCLKAGEPTEDHAIAVVWNLFSYVHTLDAIERGLLPKELDNRPPAEAQYAKAQLEAVLEKLGSGEGSIIPTESGWSLGVWKAGGCPVCGLHERGHYPIAHERCYDALTDAQQEQLFNAIRSVR